MLKILTSKQIKELDAYTIEHTPISSIDLMENACTAFCSWFKEAFTNEKVIYIFCGTGNNGGDGLGIARILHQSNYEVRVFVIKGSAAESADYKINLDRLSKLILVNTINNADEIPDCSHAGVLLDGIFGSGLSRPVEGLYAAVINKLNDATPIRVAIDMPSGLLADETSQGIIFKAQYTVSFQLPKLAFLISDNHQWVGEWHLVQIGLSKLFIQDAETEFFLSQKNDIQKILKTRNKHDHKGSFGKALLISGSHGKMGAAILAARAAMRSGIGLLTTHVPKSGVNIIQTAVPESMASVDQHEHWWSDTIDCTGFDAVGIGPGIGTTKETAKAFGKVLETVSKPLVIDADGLNILATHPEFLHLLPANSILTPHIKEFERLVGSCSSGFERLTKQCSFSKKTNSIVILKGANSSISTPEGKVYFNATGNPGMATGGSGDVLTGILTGLLAQGYAPKEAAIMGVYLHGLAGDIAMMEVGIESMIASDIISSVGKAYQQLHTLRLK